MKKGQTVVAVLTGNGLKDPNTAVEYGHITPVVIENDEEELVRHFGSVVSS